MFIADFIVNEAIKAQDEIFDSKEIIAWLKKHYPVQVIEQLSAIKYKENPFSHLYEIIAGKLRNTDKVIEMEYEDQNDLCTIQKWIKR